MDSIQSDEEWELPCELHEIEPGIIFALTNRNGYQGSFVGEYPVPEYNNIFENILSHHASQTNSVSPQSIRSDQNKNQNNSNDAQTNNDTTNNNENSANTNEQETALTRATQSLFVNPKQYYRILRRREIRTQLRNRLIRENKVQKLYNVNGNIIKHKSRHRHAKKRPRGPGGQFLKKTDK
eukprot:175022_1